MVEVKFVKLFPFAKIPSFNYETDAAMDFCSVENMEIPPLARRVVPTGLAWEPKINTHNPFYAELNKSFKIYLKIEGRSGLAIEKGIVILGGVIDETYRGEIKVIIFNSHKEDYVYIKAGDKIAQGICYLVPKIKIIEAYSINSTDRNEKGFGSSGV